MAHNSLSNTKLVVAGSICLQGASSLMLLTCFGSAGGRTRQSIAAKSHKTQNKAQRHKGLESLYGFARKVLKSSTILLREENVSPATRKGAKKTSRYAAALCASAPLREKSSSYILSCKASLYKRSLSQPLCFLCLFVALERTSGAIRR